MNEKLEAMSGLDAFMFALDDELRKTRYFQEVIEAARQEGIREGKQEAIRKPVTNLLNFGLSVEQIAEALNLSVEQVRQIAAQLSN